MKPQGFTRRYLEEVGFEGWVVVREFSKQMVPLGKQGVYLVYRLASDPASFLTRSPAGTHKGRDPTVPVGSLVRRWIPEANVVYIGKAHLTQSSDLRRRVWAYIRQGRGGKAGHWGGRVAWQLADNQDLVVAWAETQRDPRTVEVELLSEFATRFGRLPFANLSA